MAKSPIALKSIGFIELANTIRQDESLDYETRYRAAIGRLYYGVFNILLDRFLNCGKTREYSDDLRNPEQVHSSVKKCVGKIDPTLRGHIDTLRALRNFCDYQLDKDISNIVIERKYGNDFKYDDIEYAFTDAMGAVITLLAKCTNHLDCYDNRQYNESININI